MAQHCEAIIQAIDPDLLLYHLDFNRPTIERALDITANYVSTHKLILTGGTAIDMALRSKGTSIYDENALPDYDIISEHNLNHATALAEILCKEGFRDINAINAIHITTVRVRIKNVTLLDATYLPPNLMERVPYLDIGRFRLVHPNYQKVDQRLSLSTLMSDTGASLNIFNRMVKDIKRNEILRQHFEMSLPDEKQQISDIKIFTNRVKVSKSLLNIDPDHMERIDPNCFIYTGNTCIGGFLAYALYYDQYCKTHKPLEGTIDPNIKITKDTIEFDLPKDTGISILNCADNIEQTLEKLSGSKKTFDKFNALANLKPITFRAQKANHFVEVTDTYGHRFSAVEIEGMVVASTDYILMQLLRDRVFGDTDHIRNINSIYYESLLKMVLDRQQHTDSSKIWFSTINCYGYHILPEYKAFAFQKILDPVEANTYKPKNSYLRIPACQTKSGFDPSTSHYFQIDGLPNPNITHTNLKYIVDQIQKKST